MKTTLPMVDAGVGSCAIRGIRWPDESGETFGCFLSDCRMQRTLRRILLTFDPIWDNDDSE